MKEVAETPHIIITGTTQGLGFYLCKLYLSKGYSVTGFARSEAAADLDAFKASLSYKHIVSDLSNPNNIDKVYEEYKNRKSKIIILNAADYSTASGERSKNLQDQLNLNIVFPLSIIDKVIEDSKSSDREVKIIFISSIMAYVYDKANPAYGAAKAGVSAYINSMLMKDLAPAGLLNVISGPLIMKSEEASPLKKIFSTTYGEAAERIFLAARTNDTSVYIGSIWKYTIGILSLIGKERMSKLLNNFR